MARKRDYKAEYRRRIESGLARGLSKSQARGHPKRGEPKASSPEAKPKADDKINAAILEMHRGVSLTAAATSQGVSSKRLSQYVKAHHIARYKGRRWIMSDRRARRVPIIVNTNIKAIVVPDFKSASRVGSYHNAIKRFANTQDISALEPFVGQSVKDVRGRAHPFETDPNAILRYAQKGEPEFHEIYQIISN